MNNKKKTEPLDNVRLEYDYAVFVIGIMGCHAHILAQFNFVDKLNIACV